MNSIAMWTQKNPNLGESPMDRLWNRLDGIYPSLWASKFTDETYQNWVIAWAEAFIEERITPDEIRTGLASLRRGGAYPPTLPEFLKHCRPPIDYDKAFCEAVDQMGKRKRPVVRLVDGEMRHMFEQDTWSNPAIYWAARAMGSDLWEKYLNVKARWAYELDQVLSGEVKPVPKNAGLLPDNTNKSKHLTPEEQQNIENMMANLRAMFDDEEKTQ